MELKKNLPRESVEQYSKAFEKDIKNDNDDNKWFAIDNKEKKRQYEEMIKKLESIHITSDISHQSIFIRQYNRANGHTFNNIKDLEYRIDSGRNVIDYLEIIYKKFKNEKSLFNVPEMSNIIECSDNSPLKKILRDDEWKEINEEHSFHNIINNHEMLRPSDDNSRILWRTLILLPDSNISEGQYIADYLHEILKSNFKPNKYNLFSFPIDITSNGSKERKINAKKKKLYDERKLVSKSDRGHRVDLIIRNVLNMDLAVIEVVGPPHRRNHKKNLWDFRRGIRACKDSYEKFVNNLTEKYGKWIDESVIYNIYNQLEIYYV
ncbi:43432_t:CDS:2 [Gigaspora margarita]|uniref:43432_t:CDS:1 n=1 Tax=Gigaspora margarita TaxID=4874 RepID=A0ABN7VG51_GIGMA|nr:43432_t:CDS:2 [Gigaspora margarita]